MADVNMIDDAGMLDEIIRLVSKNSCFQKKMFKGWSIEEDERRELLCILRFYADDQGYGLEDFVRAYEFINHMVLEETYYFVKHGRYRNAFFDEVNSIVYQNEEYMKKYMLGLSISDYIWIQHLKMIRWFKKKLAEFEGSSLKGKSSYLEIGPGLGQYLMKALDHESFCGYLAVDLSPVSVEQCRRFLSYCGMDRKECRILNIDFFEFSSDRQFDFIVMGEVLEHVEQPSVMLEKMCALLADQGTAFVTTVINSPAADHIYLFRTKEQVLEMACAAGFCVEDYICATANDVPLQKAEERNLAVNIAMVLKKNIGQE